MLGTGGILLAVSLVTTALTYMAQNGLTVNDVFDKLSGTYDANARALSDVAKEAAKSSGTEIARLNALVSVAQDETLSREKRLIAVKELQDIYPAYFGNLKQEKILNGDVSVAVDDVSRAIRERAVATAVAGKLGELAAKRLELEEKREKAITKLKEAQVKSDADSSVYAAGLRFNLKAAVDEYKNIVKQIVELDTLSKKYSERNIQATKDSILLLQEEEKLLKNKKTFSTPQVIGVKSEIDSSGLVDLSGQVVQIAKNVQGAEGVITTSMGNIKVAFDSATIDMLETLYRFNEEAKSIITGSLTSTFNNLGTAIGEALASGKNVFQAMGNSLLASLGQFISEMGGLLIKYGVLAVAKGVLDKAIAIPGAGIIAGTAAIAVGVALKGAGAAIGNKASGKNSSVSGSTGGSYSSPASSSSYSSSGGGNFGGGTVVFEIEGSKLVGVLNNTLDKNKRLGGN